MKDTDYKILIHNSDKAHLYDSQTSDLSVEVQIVCQIPENLWAKSAALRTRHPETLASHVATYKNNMDQG